MDGNGPMPRARWWSKQEAPRRVGHHRVPPVDRAASSYERPHIPNVRYGRHIDRGSLVGEDRCGGQVDPACAPLARGGLGETFGELGQVEIGVGRARYVSAITSRVEGIGVRPMITVRIPSFVVAGASNRLLSGRSTGVFM